MQTHYKIPLKISANSNLDFGISPFALPAVAFFSTSVIFMKEVAEEGILTFAYKTGAVTKIKNIAGSSPALHM